MSTPSTPTTSLSPSSQGAFPPADRDRILDLVFDPTTGLGLEIARYNVGGSGWTSRDGPNFRAGAGVPSYQGPDGIYDWTQDAAQRAILLGARDRGAHTFEAFANSPPYWMTASGRASGAAWGCASNLPRGRVGEFADYLVAVVSHFRDAHALHFSTIAPFNEPREVSWWVGTNQEGCRFRPAEQRRVVAALGDRLRAAGLADVGVALAASDENRVDRAVSSLELTLARRVALRAGPGGQPVATLEGLAERDLSLIAHVSTHGYAGLDSRPALKAVARLAGTPVWMSEVGFGPAPPSSILGALVLASNVAADVNLMGASAWVYWQAVEDLDGGAWKGLAALRPLSSLGFRALFILSLGGDELKRWLQAKLVRKHRGEAAAREWARPWWGLVLVSFRGVAGTPADVVVSKQYHGLAHFSRFIRAGDIMLDVPAERARDTVAALSACGRRATVVVVNDAPTPRPARFDFGPFLAAGKEGGKDAPKKGRKSGARADVDSARDEGVGAAATARVWVTDPARDMAPLPDAALTPAGVLDVVVPPLAVATYVVERAA